MKVTMKIDLDAKAKLKKQLEQFKQKKAVVSLSLMQ